MLRYVAAWAVVAAVGTTVLATAVVPRIAGATPYVVLTGSMAPSYPPGTVVVSRPVPAASIRTGTVITYQLASGSPTVVTHRVVGHGVTAAGEAVFRTQGDANPVADPGWVRAVQVRGATWYAVPFVGHLTNRLNGLDRVLLQRVVAVGLLGYAALLALGAVRDRRAAVTS